MHIGAGTLFFLLLALGLWRFFPRLAAALVMLAFLGVVGVVAYAFYLPHARAARIEAACAHGADLEAVLQEIHPGTTVPSGYTLEQLWCDTPTPITTHGVHPAVAPQRTATDAEAAAIFHEVFDTATPEEAAAAVARLRARVAP